jgi:hypothetical protein
MRSPEDMNRGRADCLCDGDGALVRSRGPLRIFLNRVTDLLPLVAKYLQAADHAESGCYRPAPDAGHPISLLNSCRQGRWGIWKIPTRSSAGN